MRPLSRSNSFPAQPNLLIGRSGELAALHELLGREDVRLITITGTAGIGKTRLAIAAASAHHDAQPAERANDTAGALYVDLSTVFDPAQVVLQIGRSLGLLELTPGAAVDRVGQALSTRALLLVLDNFEQVLAAATDLANLLGATDRLKFLVTSRAPLRLRWEHIFETPPLDLPELANLPHMELATLAQIPAVALFVERAKAAGSDLRLSPANARAIAELCVRLDGVPLALELAATQTRHMSPTVLLARMEHPLDVLAAGARDQPKRQRTLREAIGWSYALLPDPHKAVFRRLGVFVGTLTLEAAQVVAAVGNRQSDVLDILSALTDQNLLRRDLLSQPDDEPSFRMLATIREYSLECLAAAGDLAAVEHKYATYWCELAERAEPHLRGPAQVVWLNRLERERPNFNAALTWCDHANQIELGVRLAAALSWFWYLRGGDRSEGRTWLERFASRAASVPAAASARARALSAAGVIASYQLDLGAAQELQQAAVRLGAELHSVPIAAMAQSRLAHLNLFRAEFEAGDALAKTSYEQYGELQDHWGMAFALSTRGLIARSQGRLDEALRYLLESLTLFREEGDRWGIAHVMLGLGHLALHRGEDDEASRCWEERLRLSREIDNQTGVAHTLDLLATLARQRGDYPRAMSRFEEALAIQRKIGDSQATAWVLQGLGELAMMRGEYRTAYTHFKESLLQRHQLGEQPGLVASLAVFARLAACLGRPLRAVRLAAAANALHKSIGPTLAVRHYSQRVLSTRAAPLLPEVERAQRRLGPQQRTAAWDQGSEMPLEQALSEALGLDTELPDHKHVSGGAAELTPRERQVAALLSRGCSNREIAAALVITEGSAHVQVVRLLNKLGFHSRTQVAVWAVTQEL